MSITLTANYKEIYSAKVVEKIDELMEENYHLDDMLEFLDEKCEYAFLNHYEDYVTAGESIGYKAVDAFVEYHGIECVHHCEDAYYGSYDSEVDFVQDYYELQGVHLLEDLVIDWEATWERNLRCDFDFIDGFVFSSNW
jgi:antirestriction protein